MAGYNTIAHNLLSTGAYNSIKSVNKKKTDSTEKLSSGYRINRSADDAAGLVISEKMRSLIRGLNQGTDNAHDGVSFVQIGDGALNEVHDMLHRMSEITVKSLNGTNTDADRAALQAEFDQLQSEIDRVTESTEFNTLKIFDKHALVYDQVEGNKRWPQDQLHTIVPPSNDTLVINYQASDDEPEKSITIQVPAGTYTTQELIDEIDINLESTGSDKIGFNFEYSAQGTCNLNYEGGQKINSFSGGLQYLLHDMNPGGSMGALIGTTVFTSDTATLKIESGQNDFMSFKVQNDSGASTQYDITIPAGKYTKQELIDFLNTKLKGSSITAESYGSSIKLGSDDKILTEFKGNMFKIETGRPIYTSVFYDNIKYGDITLSAGYIKGGAVLNTNPKDIEHNKFNITSANNTLSFRPNGAATSTTITLTQGKYTAAEMATEIQSQLDAAGLDLTASSYTDAQGFAGITITSNLVSNTSSVGSTGGTAFDTIFRNRNYTQFNTDSTLYAPSGNSYATVTGARNFTGTSPAITIKSTGSEPNNKFYINANYTNYEVTLDDGTYSSVQDIVDNINSKLSSSITNTNYKDKVSAYVDNGKIAFKSEKGSGIIYVGVGTVSGNNGYNELFRNETTEPISVSNSGTSSTPASITLNTAVTDPAVITNPSFTVYVNGSSRTATLTTGTRSLADIASELNSQLGPVTSYYKFSTINTSGSTYPFSSTNTTGNTSYNYTNFTGTGVTEAIQGSTAQKDTWAVTNTSLNAVPASMKIDSSNNTLKLTINGTEKTLTLDNNTYSRASLLSALQNKIDSAFGTGFGGAIASLDSNNRLYFKARPGASGEGDNSSISASATTSSFLKDLDKSTTSSTATSPKTLKSSITINSSNNTFTYTQNGVNHSVTLSAGTYSASTLVSELNKQFAASGANVLASLDSSYLKLTSTNAGAKDNLLFKSANNDAFATAAFNSYKSPAYATLNSSINIPVKITDSTNTFIVNGKTTTLTNGTYSTRDAFVTMLNKAFEASDAGLTASVYNGLYIRLTTKDVGTNAKIQMNYATGGTSMPAIFGSTTTPGVTASFDASNHLVITSSANNGSLTTNSNVGNIFQTGRVKSYSGYTSNTYAASTSARIDGCNLGSTVTINDYNKDLKFTYSYEGTPISVSLSMDKKTYTLPELQTALQSKLNDALGAKSGELIATVNSSGVVIASKNTGGDYKLNDFSGGFYDKVINSSKNYSNQYTPEVHNGNQANDNAFAVGRKNIRTNRTEIKKGVNDTLSYDLTIGGAKHNIEFTLDPGVYNGDSLVQEIQSKMSDVLAAKGFDPNLIKAQIGGVSTGVVGSNDSNALVFMLNDQVSLPGSGRYIIDGVGGNAAFSLFYQTDGEILTAYSSGTKDITNGITITPSDNTLTFTYDGNPVSITLDDGEYDSGSLIKAINDKLAGTGYPLASEVNENGNLKIYSTRFGKHTLDNFGGNARYSLFFEENSDNRENTDINIQLSNITDDNISIERRRMSTCYLDINSITVSKPKYAARALSKLDDALSSVSRTRSYFGAMQNRLESSIRNNENKAENTTAAESLIRDTEMASEMVNLEKSKIIEQAGMAILAQANQSKQSLLNLLN